MTRYIFLISIFTILILKAGYAQDDIQIGSPNAQRPGTTGALYDYSDPSTVNIKVQLWGYIRFPGFYVVPLGTSINELISLGGGPNEDAMLDDIRVAKIKANSETVMQKYNYNDLVWEDNITSHIKYVILDAGDIVIVPGEPRYFVREDISFYLGLLTSLASLTALVISLIILVDQ